MLSSQLAVFAVHAAAACRRIDEAALGGMGDGNGHKRTTGSGRQPTHM